MCESLGHFYLNVFFPEENAASYVAERKQEIERSSVCVLFLKSTVTRWDVAINCLKIQTFFHKMRVSPVALWWRIVRRLSWRIPMAIRWCFTLRMAQSTAWQDLPGNCLKGSILQTRHQKLRFVAWSSVCRTHLLWMLRMHLPYTLDVSHVSPQSDHTV